MLRRMDPLTIREACVIGVAVIAVVLVCVLSAIVARHCAAHASRLTAASRVPAPGTRLDATLDETNARLLAIQVRKVSLKPPQQRVRDYLLGRCKREERGLLLWHYMGTGKTMNSLSVVAHYDAPCVVFCPEYLVSVWENELRMWFGFLPSAREPGVTIYANGFHGKRIVVARFESAERAEELLATSLARCSAIVDEAQYCIDDADKRLPLVIARACGVRLLLSGTPISSVQDVGLALSVLRGDHKFTAAEFVQRYVTMSKLRLWLRNIVRVFGATIGQWFNVLAVLSGSGAFYSFACLPLLCTFVRICESGRPDRFVRSRWKYDELGKALAPYVSFVSDPEGGGTKQKRKEGGERTFATLKEHDVKVPADRALEEVAGRWMTGDLTELEIVRMGLASSRAWTLMKVSEVGDAKKIIERSRALGMYHPEDAAKSSKGRELAKLLARFKSDALPAMVFSELTSMCGIGGVAEICEGLAISYAILDARASAAAREAAVKKFNDGEVAVIINYNVCEGVSLRGCRRVVFLEAMENPSRVEQTIARARRLESHLHLPLAQREVQVFHLITAFGGSRYTERESAILEELSMAFRPREMSQSAFEGQSAVGRAMNALAEKMGMGSNRSKYATSSNARTAAYMRVALFALKVITNPKKTYNEQRDEIKDAFTSERQARMQHVLGQIPNDVKRRFRSKSADELARAAARETARAVEEMRAVVEERSIQTLQDVPPFCVPSCRPWPDHAAGACKVDP